MRCNVRARVVSFVRCSAKISVCCSNPWNWFWLQEDQFRECLIKALNEISCACAKKMDCSVRMPHSTGNPISHGLILLIRFYQVTLSPLKLFLLGPGARCRFHPTCSQYAADSLRFHGFIRGGAYAIRRILRCHPWGGSGYDPVPGTSPTSEDFHDPEHARH